MTSRIQVVRILGNDLPPRHRVRQTIDNLKFVLEHEPELDGCSKHWLINRVCDESMESEVIDTLQKAKQDYARIPAPRYEVRQEIVEAIYARRIKSTYDSQELRNLAVCRMIALNEARNYVIDTASPLADWILPLDGNCCFTKRGWAALLKALAETTLEVLAIPMYRVRDNAEWYACEDKLDSLAPQEPQVAIRTSCLHRFDRSRGYGNGNKISFLQQVFSGSNLKQTEYGLIISDPKLLAGYVFRLASGASTEDVRSAQRGQLREDAIRRFGNEVLRAIGVPEFTCDWVGSKTCRWSEHLRAIAGKPHIRALEIGCFEGRSTVWFLEHVLTHPTSEIVCIDPYSYQSESEHYVHGKQVMDTHDLAATCKRFLSNVAYASGRVRHVKAPSRIALRTMSVEEPFDFIYVDGSHYAAAVLEDLVLAWGLLRARGGILVADDYQWVGPARDGDKGLQSPKLAIDAFLTVFKHQCSILWMDSQVGILKK